MKVSLKLEYIALVLLGIYLFYTTGLSRWWYIGLFFAPDIAMIGYFINNKCGAILYNTTHHIAIAIIIFLLGICIGNVWIELTGIIILSHSAFDRVRGYGLKYFDHFRHTHLGTIEK